MNSIGTVAVAILVLVIGKVFVSLLSKEIEGRLDRLGYVILRLARRRLPETLREQLHDNEWLPEMDAILAREKDRPITRTVWSLRYSIPLLLWGAPRTAGVLRAERVRLVLRLGFEIDAVAGALALAAVATSALTGWVALLVVGRSTAIVTALLTMVAGVGYTVSVKLYWAATTPLDEEE